jgi:hypothetical protein
MTTKGGPPHLRGTEIATGEIETGIGNGNEREMGRGIGTVIEKIRTKKRTRIRIRTRKRGRVGDGFVSGRVLFWFAF